MSEFAPLLLMVTPGTLDGIGGWPVHATFDVLPSNKWLSCVSTLYQKDITVNYMHE